MELEKISCMTKEMAAQLRANGITSVEALAIRSLSELKEKIERGYMINVPYESLKKAVEEAWRFAGFWIMSASDMEKVRGKRIVFTTGSKAMDDMLGGGIFSRELTEFCGEYGSGKSQCLYTILAEALGQNKDITAIFLDSEDTFNEGRIHEIAVVRGYDPDDILKRITYVPITDSDLFSEIVDRLNVTIEAKNAKLIIIDSIIAVLRAEYVGREVLWYRQQLLNKVIRRLLNIAKAYNIPVIVSNQVVTNPQAQFTYDPIQQKVPTGGTIIGHNANTRIYLRKAKGSTRIAHLFDSSWRPEAECTVRVGPKGIQDIGEEESSQSV